MGSAWKLDHILPHPDAVVAGGVRDHSLDGIRAIAALCVFATHATYLNLLPPILNFRGAGRAGVVLFFFLSAFLISGPFFRDPRKALTWQAWTTYGLRRLFRILPLYYAVLFALFCAALEPLNRSSLSANARLLALHVTFQKGLSVFWTIVVEMRFYLVLPLLLILSALVLQKLKNGRFVLVLTGCLWIAAVATGVLQEGYLRSLGIDKHAPVFVAGILTALFFHTSKINPQSGASKVLFESLAWCSAIVFVCLSIPALYYAITQGGSLSGYAETRSPVLEAFWDDRIPWIGLYLIHLTVLQMLVPLGLPATIKLILALIFSLGVASLLFLMLEAPMISLGHRLSSRLRPEPGSDRLEYTRSA
jgi:peptidoglycan/LPS O-acetylase OafA/YrhL